MPWFVELTSGRGLGEGGFQVFVASALGFMTVQMLVGILSTTAVTLLVYGELVGKTVGARRALAATLRRCPALVGLFAVSGLMIGVGMGVIVVASLLCPIFMPLALVYYLVLSWRLSVTASVLILEGSGVLESIRRSWRLTRGSFWRWVTVSALSAAFVVWFAGFLQVGDNLEIRKAVLAGLGIPAALFQVLFVLVSALFSGVSSAVSSAAVTTYYLDTRTRKEGFDLLMRLERQMG